MARRYDIVLFGATGFAGGLTAEYLAANGPARLTWALAGRSPSKLAHVRDRLAQISPGCAELPLIRADISDEGSLRDLAEAARVIVSTVGPYLRYGEPLVAACAAAGTDYLDLTGEPEFVDTMYLRYHQRAMSTGARLIHSCGFDSIPTDLGVLFTVDQLPEGIPLKVTCLARVGGSISGGTWHSTVETLGRLREARKVARERGELERVLAPLTAGRHVHGVVGRPRNEKLANGWIVPAPVIDPQTVLRSARALDRYGPDFTYSHYLVTGGLPATVGLAGTVGGIIALAQWRTGRDLLLKLRSPGEGPSEEKRARSFFRSRFVAEAPDLEQRLITEVSGGDPGYGETAKMLAESALCLAFDEVEIGGGQVTPAVALGRRLIDRLSRAGINFHVI